MFSVGFTWFLGYAAVLLIISIIGAVVSDREEK